jgi:hypothetical protein
MVMIMNHTSHKTHTLVQPTYLIIYCKTKNIRQVKKLLELDNEEDRIELCKKMIKYYYELHKYSGSRCNSINVFIYYLKKSGN